VLTLLSSFARADQLSEYQIKAGFLYNFATFTEWPQSVGNNLKLCIYGQDPFGKSIYDLDNKAVGKRLLTVRSDNSAAIDNCHIVFIATSAHAEITTITNKFKGKPILFVADSPNATEQGVALNMIKKNNRMVFEANLSAARKNGLAISSRLLQMATKVVR